MFRHLYPEHTILRFACAHRKLLLPRKAAAQATMSGAVKLTEKEDELFTVLRQTLQYCDLKTTLRCAGGWVRDKLLNMESDDIDIALDDMLGKDFAEHVNKYLESQNTATHKVSKLSHTAGLRHTENAKLLMPIYHIMLLFEENCS